MKAKLSILLTLVLATSYISAFAATWISAWDVTTTDNTNNTTDIKAWDVNINTPTVAPTDGGSDVPLNAAWSSDTIVAPKIWIGNYPEVACDKDYFTANSCIQCFDWGKKMVWEKIAWLTDSWTNPNTTEQVIYKDEQKMPELINLGWANTVWINNPLEADKFYKFADEIVWTDSATWSGKQEFLLEWGKTVNFLESDLGASYALQSTDKKEWDAIGILKFNINFHDTDASAKESEGKLHTECVAYYAWTPAPVTPVAQTPPEATKVKTGPELTAILIIAMLLSFVLIKYKKKA